ncbi:ORF2 [White sturgeon adenovirus 1]|uniref:ORF2 n=1 Tax=White sturgeon adenovirus 1 TaxID=2580388 RepID=A0A4P8PK90_9ADEN|nr:ORF2 [White sturgeon adenovirus 1]QCQ84176.1 ORF2 [White sturgeon adenovirus 1]
MFPAMLEQVFQSALTRHFNYRTYTLAHPLPPYHGVGQGQIAASTLTGHCHRYDDPKFVRRSNRRRFKEKNRLLLRYRKARKNSFYYITKLYKVSDFRRIFKKSFYRSLGKKYLRPFQRPNINSNRREIVQQSIGGRPVFVIKGKRFASTPLRFRSGYNFKYYKTCLQKRKHKPAYKVSPYHQLSPRFYKTKLRTARPRDYGKPTYFRSFETKKRPN